MGKPQKLTTINLPHAALAEVGHVLAQAGFILGTVGGGMGEMERDGAISRKEVADLRTKMAKALFVFETETLDEVP